MTNAEWGMFLIMLMCIAFAVVTVIQADKRIKETQKVTNEYKDLYHKTYNKMIRTKTENITLETALKKKYDELSVKELCDALKIKPNVEHFTIDVSENQARYAICGRGAK